MESATTTDQHDASSPATLREFVRESYDKVERCVKDDPQTSVLITLGAGFGIGLALGLTLGGSRPPQTYGMFDRRTAEQLGQRMMANLGNWLPDSISDRF